MKHLRNPASVLSLAPALCLLLLAGCTEENPAATDLAPPTEAAALAPLAAAKPAILSYPDEIPGPPFYANFDETAIITDDGTVGILFMRDPACVPAGFNLLDGLDAPAAFGCTLTVEGRLWIKLDDPFPYQIQQ